MHDPTFKKLKEQEIFFENDHLLGVGHKANNLTP